MDKKSSETKSSELRDRMPKVAEAVGRARADWGNAHVNACIKAGMAGQANYFYAFEGGQIIGTPFTREAAAVREEDLLRIAMLSRSFFMVMREPKVA